MTVPRPTRSQGRPGTRVIPTHWERDHAPVVEKTLTGVCSIYPAPEAGGAEPVMAPDLSWTVPDVDPLYADVPCRVQHHTGSTNPQDQAGQGVMTSEYLVVVPYALDGITARCVVIFTASNDPDLNTTPALYVRDPLVGTLRFERDLMCVDDLSLVPTP